ncbi:MAG: 1-phosphofructokinase family hexose kinase [Eubacterium sp.]|nr:1-phosphofructokinase family hexose kinase [Eubacterium sp.]
MIYTLTTNPAIDLNICSKAIAPGVVNRTFSPIYTPNGKGVNVSFVLKHFGIDSKILGFFGGFTGRYIVEESEKKGVEVVPVWVDDITRINILLNDGKEEFKFINEGALVTEAQEQEMLTLIESLEDMTCLSVNGSLSKGMDDEFYVKVMEICKKKGVKVILDISSPKLKELLEYGPYLIKPNDEEIKSVFGIIMRDEKDIIDVLHMLHEKGAQNILLTLGDKGSYFFNGKEIFCAGTQPVKLLSSACAGDSALAAFLSLWLEDHSRVEEALKRSAATGANVAESSAIGDLKKVSQYAENIRVKKVG